VLDVDRLTASVGAGRADGQICKPSAGCRASLPNLILFCESVRDLGIWGFGGVSWKGRPDEGRPMGD